MTVLTFTTYVPCLPNKNTIYSPPYQSGPPEEKEVNSLVLCGQVNSFKSDAYHFMLLADGSLPIYTSKELFLILKTV